jgi:molecular chaperone DnaK
LGKAIGIDLGTSACCVYAIRDGAAHLVPGSTGSATTPCWVGIGDAGQVLVGEAARRQAVLRPKRTAFGLKRLLGRKFHSAAVGWLQALCPYDIVSAPNGDTWVRLDDRDQSPQELLAHLLRHLRTQAESFLDDEVDEVVLCVPGSFNLNQRRAIRQAATIAELPLRAMIDDTMAAALAFVVAYPNPREFVLADLGGGTFDISLFRLQGDRLEAIATAGDGLLGGSDFDRRLVELLVNAFYESKQTDLALDPTALHRLWEACRRSKQELSAATVASPIDLPHIAKVDGRPMRLHHAGLARDLLSRLGEEELDRLAGPCAWVLEDSELGTDDFDELVVIGAASRVVAVGETLAYLFRRRPRGVAQPKQIVAEGAAMHAGILRGELEGPEIAPIAPHSIGIRARGGRYRALLARNTPLPAHHQRRFAAATDGSGQLVLEVYEGEAEHVTDNAYIGRFEVAGAADRIDVSFALDSSMDLSVAMLGDAGPQALTLQPAGGLSDNELVSLGTQPPPVDTASVEPIDPLEAEPDEPTAELDPATVEQLAARPAAIAADVPIRRHLSIKPPPSLRSGGPPSTLPPPEGPIDVPFDSLVGATLGGRYVVLGAIAEGGMGRVYRARHNVLGRIFAIKVLHAELASNTDIATRFVREAQAASLIDSEHVVDISDFGKLEDGAGYFVMEHLDGPTLAQLITERGVLDTALICAIGVQLCDGLIAAHACDIIHRDLKPDNVTLIKRSGHDHFCKILDFGIAKSPTTDSSKRLTMAGALMGTPHYMAPEQIDSGDIDPRTDLYALGAVLYEMATGQPPFEADSIVALLVQHKIEPPIPPTERTPGIRIPEKLETLILQCLEKDPDKRPDSARAVRKRLSQISS